MDLICYSHLRWDFVYQRPQHLLSRMAKHFRVFYIEEPVFDAASNFVDHQQRGNGIWILVPHLVPGLTPHEIVAEQGRLLSTFFKYVELSSFIAWYYTPMALDIDFGTTPALIVYDCMDELSAFKNAPVALREKEAELFRVADIVFTGGASLYEAKKECHKNVYLFPSSIDKAHFETARAISVDPADQENIPHPRVGFFGVIDERMDLPLVAHMAAQRPGWHIVFIGPVVKIDPQSLPQAPNIHWLGKKTYEELPQYIAGWDVAMMPFILNESTQFISPTKTPEYLAAGKPVVATAIQDVATEYGNAGLVYMAEHANDFITGIGIALDIGDKSSWLKAVDAKLATNSWDNTSEKMLYLINIALSDKTHKKNTNQKKEDTYV